MIPMAGYAALMEQLSTHDYRRALASTSSRDWVDFVVDGLQVRPDFQAIVAGDEVASRKPAPDVYLRAAERLGVAPKECVALEDSAPGVAAAKAAGMACIAVPNRVTVSHDLSAADFQVAHLGEISVERLRLID
jgi:putative hydrolase of the HAD superfamily